MKSFELSSKNQKNGKRHFKAILYKIFPDSCVDEVNQVGTEYNKNGITWIEEYCKQALPSIEGMSLRCEFIDEDRTEILGHGETGIEDGEPIYENAVQIGTFVKGYIDTIEVDGETITACIGEGYIDSQCYHNFVKKLDTDAIKGIYPNGSVEIMRTDDNESIIYKYGYKSEGRIPMMFKHSGYALLGVAPADDSAKLIELNKKHKEDLRMNEEEIKNLVSQIVDELKDYFSETNKEKEKCEEQVKAANEETEKVVAEKEELIANSTQIQKALDDLKVEYEELNKKWDELWGERNALEKALSEAKAQERIDKMEKELSKFTDEEKTVAKTEIEEFKKDPNTCEINSIVAKIYANIGKKAKENQPKIPASNTDIFGEVASGIDSKIDTNIF